MTEALLVINGLLMGLSVALVVSLWRDRAQVRKAEADLKAGLASVLETHNSLAKQVVTLVEQVSSHDFKINGTTRPWASATKQSP